MNYWLMKSEPSVFSIDDLARDGQTSWEGVRNYQARNYMRDSMKKGDLVLFYHSNAEPSGIAGVAKICKEGYVEPSEDKARWFMVDVAFVEKFKNFVSLEALKQNKSLQGMLVIKRGMRLSVQPVEKKHFEAVIRMSK